MKELRKVIELIQVLLVLPHMNQKEVLSCLMVLDLAALLRYNSEAIAFAYTHSTSA